MSQQRNGVQTLCQLCPSSVHSAGGTLHPTHWAGCPQWGWTHLEKGLGGLEGMLQVHHWPLGCINLGCLPLESCHCMQLFWVGPMVQVVCLGDCCFFCLFTSLCLYLGDSVLFLISSSLSLSKHSDLQLSCSFTFPPQSAHLEAQVRQDSSDKLQSRGYRAHSPHKSPFPTFPSFLLIQAPGLCWRGSQGPAVS